LILGLVGAVRGLFGSAFRKRVAWGALSAMAFLLAWPTKWPHYVLVATPFLSLTASDALIRGRRARVLLSAIGLLSMTVSVRMIMGQRPYLEPDLLAHRIPKPFDARWEGIRLEGLRWEGTEAREGVPSLVVCWRPERSVDSNLSVFVHLLGETPNPRTGPMGAWRGLLRSLSNRPATGFASRYLSADHRMVSLGGWLSDPAARGSPGSSLSRCLGDRTLGCFECGGIDEGIARERGSGQNRGTTPRGLFSPLFFLSDS
jgi:hypothetical protein